jgi:hypothetical protein
MPEVWMTASRPWHVGQARTAVVDPDRDALEDALRQIELIDQRLQAHNDEPTLSHFGEAEAGRSIAALLGHTLLTTAEARVVDQLSRMPEGTRLVRTYLGLSRVPHLSDVKRMTQEDERTPTRSLPRVPSRPAALGAHAT